MLYHFHLTNFHLKQPQKTKPHHPTPKKNPNSLKFFHSISRCDIIIKNKNITKLKTTQHINMICPNCKNTPLFILEFKDIELDFCPECLGIWFDSEELQWILQGNFIEKEKFEEQHSSSEQPKKCPRCRKNMKKVVSKDIKTVLYDICPAGHGIWFDREEIENLVEHYKELPGAESFLNWLSEVFHYEPQKNSQQQN